MELTHTFSVPTGIEETWAHFGDIAALAECFPGARVTSVDDGPPATFVGTCKVKLGPIALVYTGSGTFTERDEDAHRFVVEAKGKDKRGNGTAGALVTVAMVEAGAATEVEVRTDLSITGKPAQFGRGVMQDVSDKLLAQFVACLERRLGDQGPPDEEAGTPGVGEPGDGSRPSTGAQPGEGGRSGIGAQPGDGGRSRDGARSDDDEDDDDALDLGAATFVILTKTYGKQLLGILAALLILRWLWRRRH
ncbi:SRPBCC family protein [Nocardioides limicola]|uniref:SRPBCC family protein n=1 Tax=Nocardioides limicola TaxID=2803368 RepID=UPI00193B2935|nr:SRPBCC family protein [Nocardioides sp. DJM-14]